MGITYLHWEFGFGTSLRIDRVGGVLPTMLTRTAEAEDEVAQLRPGLRSGLGVAAGRAQHAVEGVLPPSPGSVTTPSPSRIALDEISRTPPSSALTLHQALKIRLGGVPRLQRLRQRGNCVVHIQNVQRSPLLAHRRHYPLSSSLLCPAPPHCTACELTC